MAKLRKVAIIGANGYAGLELTRLLLNHPYTELTGVFGRNEEWQLIHDLPELTAQSVPYYPLTELRKQSSNCDVIFLATPSSTSMELAPGLLEQGCAVIDLSGAFRLSENEFTHWYQEPHTAPHLFSQTQYGLSPWWNNNEKNKKNIKLIANPGCFATCSLMALLPLLKANLIDPESIIIDAKSGLSGAGRKVLQNLLFCEVSNDFYPYKIGHHQHTPEIEKYLQVFSNVQAFILLTTQILPLKRGLFASIYAKTSPNLNVQQLNTAYQKAYANYPLVKFSALDKSQPEKNKVMTSLKQVVGSTRTHISYQIHQNKLILFSCLDNLLKGAASQAIENLNALYDLPLETGLSHWEGTL